jgi:hypothetical protein
MPGILKPGLNKLVPSGGINYTLVSDFPISAHQDSHICLPPQQPALERDLRINIFPKKRLDRFPTK